MTKIISENKKRCTTVNNFSFMCFFFFFIYFIYFFFFFFFVYLFFLFFFCQNHLIITSDVIICTGYTIYANTLSKGTCCMFIGVKTQES